MSSTPMVQFEVSSCIVVCGDYMLLQPVKSVRTVERPVSKFVSTFVTVNDSYLRGFFMSSDQVLACDQKVKKLELEQHTHGYESYEEKTVYIVRYPADKHEDVHAGYTSSLGCELVWFHARRVNYIVNDGSYLNYINLSESFYKTICHIAVIYNMGYLFSTKTSGTIISEEVGCKNGRIISAEVECKNRRRAAFITDWAYYLDSEFKNKVIENTDAVSAVESIYKNLQVAPICLEAASVVKYLLCDEQPPDSLCDEPPVAPICLEAASVVKDSLCDGQSPDSLCDEQPPAKMAKVD